jgi:hypothetical protein
MAVIPFQNQKWNNGVMEDWLNPLFQHSNILFENLEAE